MTEQRVDPRRRVHKPATESNVPIESVVSAPAAQISADPAPAAKSRPKKQQIRENVVPVPAAPVVASIQAPVSVQAALPPRAHKPKKQ